MTLRDVLKALQTVDAERPGLLDQKVVFVLGEDAYDILLANVYGDNRIVFIPDFGGEDGSAMDASEEN